MSRFITNSSVSYVRISELVKETEFLDYNTPIVQDFVKQGLGADPGSEVERAVKLYYAVRDGLFYEVYGADLSRTGLRASAIIERGRGFCMHKSIVYAAAVRAAGIPSRLVLANVRNHLASDRLKELVGGEVFHHCLTSVFLHGRWIKATPVFNKMLCRLYRIAALDFDGLSDSMYHPDDESNQRYMEFLEEPREYDDFPYDTVLATMRSIHPNMFEGPSKVKQGSLIADAMAKIGSRSASSHESPEVSNV